jgi:hypothetical protein
VYNTGQADPFDHITPGMLEVRMPATAALTAPHARLELTISFCLTRRRIWICLLSSANMDRWQQQRSSMRLVGAFLPAWKPPPWGCQPEGSLTGMGLQWPRQEAPACKTGPSPCRA